MKKKRLNELEENITGIEPQYEKLMELYNQFSKAPESEKSAIREQAEKYLKQESKLKHFPPNDADIAGMVSLHEWHNFIQFNFKQKALAQ